MALSEPTKRKRFKNIDDSYCLVEYIDSNEFSVIKVVYDDDDDAYGSVRDKHGEYRVKIVKKGSKDYVERKAKKHAKGESLTTADEDIVFKMNSSGRSKILLYFY